MAVPEQHAGQAQIDRSTSIRRRRRKRRRQTPIFPFFFLGALALGIFLTVSWIGRLRLHQAAGGVPVAKGFVSDLPVLRREFEAYYGKPITEPRIETQFRRASGLESERNYPGAASVLEVLSHSASVPVVFSDLGVMYTLLGDSGRAADAFREVLARDANYPQARQFLHTTKSIEPGTAEPYRQELEPNNEAATANLIALKTAVGGEIGSGGGDIDYFRVIAPPAPRDLIAVELSNHSVGFAPQLHIYDANLRPVAWGEKTAAAGESLRVLGGAQPNATLYLAISTEGSKGGQYMLSVKPQHAFDTYEPNDEIVSARKITPGQEIQATIMDADDTDYYSFQSPRKGSVTIDIAANSSALIPALTTYNQDRANMGFGPELRQPGSALHYAMNVEKGQIYYVQVWSQSGTAGAYTLVVQ